MRCITNIYISVLFLTVSVFNYDGKAFYTDDKIVIAIKVLLYLAVIPVDLFILNKWVIPKCTINQTVTANLTVTAYVLSVLCFLER